MGLAFLFTLPVVLVFCCFHVAIGSYCCENANEVNNLIDKVKEECEYLIPEDDNENFHRLILPSVFIDYCEDFAEAVAKDQRKKTGNMYLCERNVLPIVSRPKESSEEDYAKETVSGFQILIKTGKELSEVGSFIAQNPALKQKQADCLAKAFFEAGSSPKVRSLLCSHVSHDGSCPAYLGGALNKAGFKLKESPFLAGAITETATGLWIAYSAHKKGDISASEMETAMLAVTAKTIGGAAAGYGGWMGGLYLSSLVLPSSVLAGLGCSWVGSWLGHRIGTEAGRKFLDWFLDGQVSELDKVRHCRKVLGNVKFNATVKEIRAAYRSVSKRIHPDKGGSEKGQLEANMCVAMLQEKADEEAQPYFAEFFKGLSMTEFGEIFKDIYQ